MIIRKFYLIKNEPHFSQFHYPQGANEDDVKEGKIEPVLIFYSFALTDEKQEITEESYKKIIKETSEIRNKKLLEARKQENKHYESGLEKLQEAGFTKEEIKALFK